jgi:hypothetical protein
MFPRGTLACHPIPWRWLVYSQTLRPLSCTPRKTAQPSASNQDDGTISCRNNGEAYFAKAVTKNPIFLAVIGGRKWGRCGLRGWGRGRCGAAPAFGTRFWGTTPVAVALGSGADSRRTDDPRAAKTKTNSLARNSLSLSLCRFLVLGS